MTRTRAALFAATVAAAGLVVTGLSMQAPGAGVLVLASVEIPKAVWVGGRRLPAGSYRVVRLDEPVRPGSEPRGQHWVELVRDGTTQGRELATVVAPDMADRLAGGAPRPDPDGARVDELAGSYVRIWINRGALDYMISLPLAPE